MVHWVFCELLPFDDICKGHSRSRSCCRVLITLKDSSYCHLLMLFIWSSSRALIYYSFYCRDGKIATDRVYPILLLSGLPKEKLGFIWGLCNQQTPGQLIVKELVQILAIIALTQVFIHLVS